MFESVDIWTDRCTYLRDGICEVIPLTFSNPTAENFNPQCRF